MDISKNSDLKSQDEIPVLRPRALFKENFCGRRISSGHTELEVQLRMFTSYRSLGLAYLIALETSFYTNK